MANPRNVVDFTDIDASYETYKIDNSTITYSATQINGSAQVGLAVELSTDDTVALTQDANPVLGKLIKVEADLKATIQTGGYMKLPSGAGAALTIGRKIVGDLDTAARGYIREMAPATLAEVANARGIIINNDDTANVVVRM